MVHQILVGLGRPVHPVRPAFPEALEHRYYLVIPEVLRFPDIHELPAALGYLADLGLPVAPEHLVGLDLPEDLVDP